MINMNMLMQHIDRLEHDELYDIKPINSPNDDNADENPEVSTTGLSLPRLFVLLFVSVLLSIIYFYTENNIHEFAFPVM
jgi:hypothetical protein